MTSINASCPCCQDVTLEPPDITLIIIRPVINKRDLSYYIFRCPKCHDEVKKTASDSAQKTLINAGIAPELVEVPDEVYDARRDPFTRLTVDEVLDFTNLDQEGLQAIFFRP